ncbi:C6 finger domain [Mycena kentingensis (nom. inval.)]|nr:C6 finger domain [Mycena kentingensis (nom. inval.)]KAF7330072.1 C6 finger domain [Mycena kentingensis (nom. inval.)]
MRERQTKTSVAKRRPRAFIACVNCRRRRVKCNTKDDYDVPCERCIQRGLQCCYIPIAEDIDYLSGPAGSRPRARSDADASAYPATASSSRSISGSPPTTYLNWDWDSGSGSGSEYEYFTGRLPALQPLLHPPTPPAPVLPDFDAFLRGDFWANGNAISPTALTMIKSEPQQELKGLGYGLRG